MDEFKKYIRENRSQMDLDIPGPHVWTNIRKKQKSTFSLFFKYAVASCVLALVISTIYFLTQKNNSQMMAAAPSVVIPKNDLKQMTVIEKPRQLSATDITEPKRSSKSTNLKKNDRLPANPKKKFEIHNTANDNSVAESFGQIQKSFAIIINHQLNKIKTTPLYGEDANYFSVFKKEFQDLNVDELGARQEIVNNGLSDIEIQKLINIYQQKILLLKRLQLEINKVNTHAPNNTDDKLKEKPTYINI